MECLANGRGSKYRELKLIGAVGVLGKMNGRWRNSSGGNRIGDDPLSHRVQSSQTKGEKDDVFTVRRGRIGVLRGSG